MQFSRRYDHVAVRVPPGGVADATGHAATGPCLLLPDG